MADTNRISSHAKVTIEHAAEHLRESLTAGEFEGLQSTTLDDVRNAALQLDRDLAERGERHNLRRLEPFFKGLEKYSEIAKTLLKDTRLLCWLWASREYLLALDEVLPAYKRFGQTLLSVEWPESVIEEAGHQQVLATMYADIVEFHWWTYRLVKGPAQEGRERWQRQLRKQEKNEAVLEMNNVRTWLNASTLDQEDELSDLLQRCHEGSCEWVYENQKIKSWIRCGPDHSVLWLKGKPGAGKSVLCSKLVDQFRNSKQVTILYFLCTEAQPETKRFAALLRVLISQLIQRRPELCGIVQADYINDGSQPNVAKLRQLIHQLASAFSSIRIVVDGIDECEQKEQDLMLKELAALAKASNLSMSCKVLISSRDLNIISKHLRSRSSIDLSQEDTAISAAISGWVRARITDLRSERINEELATKVEQTLLNKADGMFLWVHLVMSELEEAYTIGAIETALDGIPRGLDKIYDRIFQRFLALPSPNYEIASRIFQWLATSRRPMQRFEIQHAVSLDPNNRSFGEESRVVPSAFELCKPLIESGPHGSVRFVHVSVKEYILKHEPLFKSKIAQFNASFACLAYLNTSVTLLDHDHDELSHTIEVASGVHALCRYASRHWADHLLEYLETTKDDTDSDPKALLGAAHGLANALAQVMPQIQPDDSQIKLDRRFELLSSNEPILSMAMSTILPQIEEKVTPRRIDQSEANKDPFSKLRSRYDEISMKLLQAESVPGLDDKMLHAFRNIYGSSILSCRFSNCPRGNHGFQTSNDRDEQESTHLSELRCPHAGCNFNPIGVRSAKKLRQHMQDFHNEARSVRVPPKIRPSGEDGELTDPSAVEVREPYIKSHRMDSNDATKVDETARLSNMTWPVEGSKSALGPSVSTYTNEIFSIPARVQTPGSQIDLNPFRMDMPKKSSTAPVNTPLEQRLAELDSFPSTEASTHPASTLSHEYTFPYLEDRDRPIFEHLLHNILPHLWPVLEAVRPGETAKMTYYLLHRNEAYLHAALQIAATYPNSVSSVSYRAAAALRHSSAFLKLVRDALLNTSVARALSNDNDNNSFKDTLDAILGMVYFQSCAGSESCSENVLAHFQGACVIADRLNLVDALVSQPYPVPFRTLLTVWIDIIAAATRGKAPRFAHVYRKLLAAEARIGLSTLMGCDDCLMYVIAEIAYLENEYMENRVGVNELFSGIEALLQSKPVFQRSSSGEGSGIISQITDLFRSAARTYLCSIGGDSIMAVDHVSGNSFQWIPSGPTGFDRCLVWPLMIGGLYSSPESSFRRAFLSRCNSMGERAHEGNFGRMVRLLEEVWKRRESEEHDPLTRPLPHWRVVMREMGEDFLLI